MKDTWTLGFPNDEVYRGFASSLYLYYTDNSWDDRNTVSRAFKNFKWKEGSFEQFLEAVRKWYAGIPYSITYKNQNEQFYQSLFYALLIAVGADVQAEEQTSDGRMDVALKMPDAILLIAVGADVQAEEQTSDGRMDVALKMPDAIYILEFKYGKTTEDASQQIKEKDYAVRFASDTRPVYAVGLNVSTERRTIDSYTIEQLR